MKIKHKLSSSVLVIILGFILSTLVQFEMQQRINQVYQLKSISTVSLSQWNRLNSVTKGFLISQRPVEELQQEYTRAFAGFRASLAELIEYSGSEQINGEIDQKINALSDLWDMYEVNFQIIDETTQAITASRLKEEIGIQGVLSFFLRSIHSDSLSQQEYQLLQNIDSNISSIEAAAAKFQAAIFELNILLDHHADQLLQRSRNYSLSIASIVIVCVLVFATSVSFRISRRVQHVETTMRRAAQRNIAVRYTGRARDEITSLGRNLNTVLETMQEFFSASGNVAQSLETLKEQLSHQSSDSVSEMKAITSHLTTIADDFNRLDTKVSRARDESRQIAGVVNAAQASIQDQSNPLNTISAALSHMKTAIQEVVELTEHFGSSSQTLLEKTKAGSGNVLHMQRMISQVTKEIENLVHVNEVIEGITEQTHLLSINASIESANAGEAGKSFGVVAHEIKKLAETTAAHSHRIEKTLQHITEIIRSADEQSKRSADSFDAIQTQVHSNVDLFKTLQAKTDELQISGQDIIISNREVETLTSKLTQEYTTIQRLSASIQNAMNTASDSSGEGVTQITSIKSSVEQVEASLHRMAEALEVSHYKTRQLTDLLNSFRT